MKSGFEWLLEMRSRFIVDRAVTAAAQLGIADWVDKGVCTTEALAREVHADEAALYRLMRMLAGNGVFEETGPRTFGQTEFSKHLRTDDPETIRPTLLYWGHDVFYRSLGEMRYSVETGKAAREMIFGMDEWEYMRRHPDLAEIFDNAMTNLSGAIATAIAAAYDFGAWGSVMDVGGGNGVLLATILRRHAGLRGVLADQPQVLERAKARGFLGGDLEGSVGMEPCDFFKEVPRGCRAIVMKSVLHDWDDARAAEILRNCRKALPEDGAVLVVEYTVGEANVASSGKIADLAMLVLTGGRERTAEEFAALLKSAGFAMKRVVETGTGMAIVEALTV